MKIAAHDILRETESVCPACLLTAPATIYKKANGEVYMHKICRDHGEFDVYVWPDAQRYRWFNSMAFPAESRAPQTEISRGCPQDCGLCSAHQRTITLPEIEVTWRCNLSCPVCFMFDGDIPADPSIKELQNMFETIRRFDGQNLPIQISGGEPTIRDDLASIIAIARKTGFSAVELNTNGLVIGKDVSYLRKLKNAGLTDVYLQFDGLNPETTIKLRGRNVLADKLQAIENCRMENLPVILSVTIVKGINDNELGDLIRYSMSNLDVIRGLALQPAFESGRFAVNRGKHLSVGDVALLISEQTGGKVAVDDIWPVSSSHPLCYGSTFLVGAGDDFKPFTRNFEEDEYRRLFDRSSPQGAVFQDIVARIAGDTDSPTGLPILIMEYMDAWTMDLERARSCNLAVTVGDGTSIPFCIYHLTDGKGRRLQPHGDRRRYGRRA